ncbi:asparaginase [Cohnella hongkongensis]|uniref:Asparaginase n=1 Tax=Cohnella hongkongensis TaxID=178337 RepID=A0ABV9FBR9_9BACL
MSSLNSGAKENLAAKAEPVVLEYRGGFLENVHYGHVCAVNDRGGIAWQYGDPGAVTFMRSAAKPIQALPFFLGGFDEKFGFTPEEQAIMMASHRALPYHVKALEGMLAKLGLDERALVCKPTYPLDADARDALVAERLPQRRIYHNCSGKHLGVLAACIGLGETLDNYDSPDHPVQRRIAALAAELAECPPESIRIGTDGCGFPVFGMPLRNMATAFLKLACPDLIADPALREAVGKATRLMNAFPRMISAEYLICPNLLMDDNIVAKGGAKGIYCFALRKERLGFALKIVDGSEDEWPIAVASILEQIGYGNRETIARMHRIGSANIWNDNGRVIGENRCVIQLRKE